MQLQKHWHDIRDAHGMKLKEKEEEVLVHTIFSNTLVFEFYAFLLPPYHMFQRLNYFMQAVGISPD